MKNFANLILEVLSSEELMAVRGGDSPIAPIIIKDSPKFDLLSTTKKYSW